VTSAGKRTFIPLFEVAFKKVYRTPGIVSNKIPAKK